MSQQLSLFPENEATTWAAQRRKWWDMHGFNPKAGDVVLIDVTSGYCLDRGCDSYCYGLEANVISISKEKDEVRVKVKDYPDCPWIRRYTFILPYYGIDPILYK